MLFRSVPSSVPEAGFAAAQSLGVRTFPVELTRQIFEREREINTELSAVMRDFSRARWRAEQAGRRWNEDPEVLRLADIYRALQEARSGLPLKAIRGATRERGRERRAERAELKGFALAG